MRMNKFALINSLFFLAASAAMTAPAAEPPREIMGLRLEMTKEQARTRLQEIGTFERDERKQQQVWKVRDDSFSHLIIGVGKDEKLRFITAVAREDKEAKRLPYSEIGKLDAARQAGDVAIKNFNYEWNIPADKNQPQTLVNGRGRDPKYLSTYSLKRLGQADE